ncbi:MAG: hypothetical protein QNK20_08160 [Aureibaculum sp.]|nr:hypothetical protein [Aureibaculum sp.]
MVKKKDLVALVLSIFLFSGFFTSAWAQEIEKDSISTAFRKGRWLTGLSGFISSGSTQNTSSDNITVSNRYRIEISSGKFIKDRLNLGFNVNMERANIEDDEVRTTENALIGPKGTYFFSKSKIGSMFLSFSPGLMVYREKTVTVQDNSTFENISKGSGFGTMSTVGYSYVLYDLVTLDLGLNWSAFRINTEQSSSLEDSATDVNIVINDLSFSFGFKILLGN